MWIGPAALVAYFALYGLLHSLLAARPVKEWLQDRLGPGMGRWYRLAYNLFAAVSLLPFFWLLATLPDRILYVVPGPWNRLMMAGQALAGLGFLVALFQTDLASFLGLSQLRGESQNEHGRLVVRGMYAYVRHPLYLFSMLFLWLSPVMTVNLFTAYLAFTLYFYLGSLHEESRLRAAFGPAYRRYQEQVPMFLPRWRRHPLDLPLDLSEPRKAPPTSE